MIIEQGEDLRLTPDQTAQADRDNAAEGLIVGSSVAAPGAPPRVKGHTLRSEGAAYSRGEDGRRHIRVRSYTTSGVGYGLCSCGATSGILDSARPRKAWHRDHRAEVFVCESCGQPAGVTLKDGSFWCHSCNGSARRLGYAS